MKRVLVSTLHFYNNYGSVLQAYAVRKALTKFFGMGTVFFPYRPNLKEYSYFTDPVLEKGYLKKKAKFDQFRINALRLPPKNCSSVEGAYSLISRESSDYDAFIAGSDIIWGREFSLLASPYFLQHKDEGKPAIAYAASVLLDKDGHTVDDDLFRRGLKNFTSISVRETSAVESIRRLCPGVDVEAVLDPTLLLDFQDYEPLEEDISAYAGEPYILSYFLTHDPAVVDYTNMIARKQGLRIIHYFADYPNRVFPADTQCFAFTGPGEFLSLIKNASLIFTNSFHGTCFSMIYHRPFYTYTAKRKMISRVMDTIDRLGMKDRCFTDFRDLSDVTMEIDYSVMEEKRSREKETSIAFLERALGVRRV